jgi:hypothetical protein
VDITAEESEFVPPLRPYMASEMLDAMVPALLTPLLLPTLPGLQELLTGEGVDALLPSE